MNDENQQMPVVFEDVDEPSKPILTTEKKDVTPFDKFKLAKGVLLFCFILFTILATVHGLWGNDRTQEIWDYAKVILSDISLVVIGFYFGSKESEK